MRIDKPQGPGTSELSRQSVAQAKAPGGTKPFAEVLNSKIVGPKEPVRFSAHAVQRLASRNITLTERDVSELGRAVEKLEQRGGKESLMLMGDMAFVVSIRNRTVITALDSQTGSEDKVFTNIDSALIM